MGEARKRRAALGDHHGRPLLFHWTIDIKADSTAADGAIDIEARRPRSSVRGCAGRDRVPSQDFIKIIVSAALGGGITEAEADALVCSLKYGHSVRN